MGKGQSLLASYAFRTTALYVVLSAAWIVVSDWVLHLTVKDPNLAVEISVFKGWVYTGVAALFLYMTIFRYERTRDALERRIAAGEARARSMADATDDLVIAYDKDARIVAVNAVVGRALRLPDDKMLDHISADLFGGLSGARPLEQSIQQAMASGKTVNHEFAVTLADGTLHTFDTVVMPVVETAATQVRAVVRLHESGKTPGASGDPSKSTG